VARRRPDGLSVQGEQVIALKAVYVVVLLACCSLGPGLLIVRRLRGWWPLERLCAAVAFSLFIVYLAGSVFYGLGWGSWAYHLFSGICLVLLAVCARDLYAMFASRRVRRAMLWLTLLSAWSLATLTVIRHYSGGGWMGDWLEHFQRCLFFLRQFPGDVKFILRYDLPARPPLMNVVGAYVLAQVGVDFPAFQVTFLLLNALIFLPCALLASSMARRGARRVALAAMLFALNPMFIQNVTYTWTKLLGGFYALLATWVYLRALRKDDTSRLLVAVALLAMGVLVHYSAAVYLVALAVHYLVFAFRRRRRKWLELPAAAAVMAAVMATWLSWSIAVYGWQKTFASNTAVTTARQFSAWGNAEKIASNLIHTVVPHFFYRIAATDVLLVKDHPLTYWRDFTFLIYQTNVLFAMGSVGGIVIAGLFLARMLRKDTAKAQRGFWLTFVILTLVGGVAVVGEKDYFGLAHLCLQPFVLLGATFLAVNLPALPLVARCLVAVGATFDFAVGILLNLWVEHITERPELQGDQLIAALEKLPLNTPAKNSLGTKIINGILFWGDHPMSFFYLALSVMCVLMAARMIWGFRKRAGPARLAAGGPPRGTT
jgi:hypothetical protein